MAKQGGKQFAETGSIRIFARKLDLGSSGKPDKQSEVMYIWIDCPAARAVLKTQAPREIRML